MTPTEFAEIAAYAAERGMPVSEVLRGSYHYMRGAEAIQQLIEGTDHA